MDENKESKLQPESDNKEEVLLSTRNKCQTTIKMNNVMNKVESSVGKKKMPFFIKKEISLKTEQPPVSFECDYHTTRANHLKELLKIHTRKKSYSCTFCEYTTARTGHLKRHLQTHTGEKPYSCMFCKYSATTASNLKRHILGHTGEKPYSCKFCEYSCAGAGDLKKHIMKHTGEKPYSCTFCEYTCAQTNNLKRHLLTHLQGYSCTYADKVHGLIDCKTFENKL